MTRPVCLQVLYPGLGGHGSVAFSLIAGDTEKRYAHALSFFGIEPALSSYVERCERERIAWSSVRKRPGLDTTAWRAAYRAILGHAPDAVVLHTPSLLPVVLAARRARRFRLLVVDHQDHSARAARDWVSTAWAAASADRLVVLTAQAAAGLEAKLGRWVCSRLTVIENGIDLDAFAPGEDPPAPPPLRIAMASRLNSLRDHTTVLRALTALPNCEFTIAGEGPTQDELQRSARELGVSDRVTFAGALGEAALVRVLRDAHAVVHSTRAEMMSTAIMQAMAVAKPVVATDIPGVRAILSDGEDGLLFNLGDSARLVEHLERLAADPALRSRLGTHARQTAVARFDHRRMFASYDRLLSPRRMGPLACSIVIPTYNRAHRLRPAIESALDQDTNDDFEVIVVDDGSTDATERLVASIEDPRLRYVHKPNGERGAARNFGVRHARGDYVYFLDSDDLVTRDHVSHGLDCLRRNGNPEFMHSRFVWRGPDGAERKQRYPATGWRRALVRRNYVGSYLWLRRDIALAHPFIEDRRFNVGEDWYLALVLAARYDLHLSERATRVVVSHEEQTMTSAPEVFARNCALLTEHLAKDPAVAARFPHAVRHARAELTSVAALQSALQGRPRDAVRNQLKAIAARPSLAFERRTVAVLRRAAGAWARGYASERKHDIGKAYV